jgi:hypothetical protein
MFHELPLVTQFLFDTMDSFVPLYFAGGLFSIPFALWVIRKIAKLIKRLA